jgi:hypothetical protein
MLIILYNIIKLLAHIFTLIMSITTSFNRPKLATSLSESVVLSAAIAEGTDEFIVDINVTVTRDDTNTVTKTLCRVKLPFTINGTTLKVTDKKYIFPGNATSYSSGGNTPALSTGQEGNTIDLNAFFALAGDAQKNS